MRSWHLVPKITYSIQKFSKHSCVPVLGLQFKQSVKALGLLLFNCEMYNKFRRENLDIGPNGENSQADGVVFLQEMF